MKKILVIEYSQTGQLTAVLDAMLAPLTEPESEAPCTVRREVLRPVTPYPFPWPFWQFLDTFPETVALDAPPIQPIGVAPDESFDLIVLGFPVWFLSPPPPLTAFLQSAEGRRLLAGRPVITVTACRNMWLMAQEDVKALLAAAGARHCDHVALVDQGSAFATFITTPRWMWTGRRDRFLGLPPAGVAPAQIAACRRFGRALRHALARNEERGPGPLLHGLRACTVDARLIASERVGKRSFRIWARALRALGRPGAVPRRMLLAVYLVFLLTLILTVVPLSMLLKALLRPLIRARLEALKLELEKPSGAGDSRLALFHE